VWRAGRGTEEGGTAADTRVMLGVSMAYFRFPSTREVREPARAVRGLVKRGAGEGKRVGRR